MKYKIKAPNALYNGVTEGVSFSNGIGKTDDKNIFNILINDYGYQDITPKEEAKEEEGKSLKNKTVAELKALAKKKGLTGYSDLKHAELVRRIEDASK